MKKDVKRYIQGYDICQRTKITQQTWRGPIHPLPMAEAPWTDITIDMIGPLPLSEGKDTILVIVDRFSKMI
jgi:hypothetical protein